METNARDVLQGAVNIVGGVPELATYLAVEEAAIRAELNGHEALPTDAMLLVIDLVIAEPSVADGLFAASGKTVAPRPGLEPGTCGLTVRF